MSSVLGNIISDEIDVASNEYLTKFSVNRNFVKLLSNDNYLLSRVRDDDSTVYSYNIYKSYKINDLVFFKTSLSAQNTYLLCSLTSNNNFVPSCVFNTVGNLVVVNDDHWKMVGVPALPQLSGQSPTDKADEYILSSYNKFVSNHQQNTAVSAHPLGPFSRQNSSVLFTDLTNLKSDRSTLFYPYKVQKMTSDDTILDGYMRKWDNGILEYDIVFRVGYQGQTEEGYDLLEANNTYYIHRNMNYMYFKNRKDYGIFNQGGKFQSMINGQKQTNLNKTINAYVGQIVFPEEFKDLNYMVFSSNTKSITTRTYNTKNDVIPYEEIDNRLSVTGLTLINHTILSSDDEYKKLYDTPVTIHESIQNIAEESMADIYNDYSSVIINILSDANIINIDDKAFFKTQLTSVVIPFSTRHIGIQAFAKCSQLKHIDFYVERNPALHPKIELCAFGDTSKLTSINIIYRSPSMSTFGASPLDDPEVARLSTYNDIPLEDKLRNDLIRTYIYGINHDFDPENIKVYGEPLKYITTKNSNTLVSIQNNEDHKNDNNIKYKSVNIKQFLSDFKSGKMKNQILMGSSYMSSSNPFSESLTTYFEFNDDKTELINWNRSTITSEFEFDSVALLSNSEYSTVSSIADFSLSGCNFLTSFRAGYPLKRIGYASLSGCSNLRNIVLSDSILTVNSHAFSDCSSVNRMVLSCSSSLNVSELAFANSIIPIVNILPNSIVKSDAFSLTANTICADMSGSFFEENSMRLNHLTSFHALNLSSSLVNSTTVPPLSGFSFNAFSGCDIRKFIAEDGEAHDISGIFVRPTTLYPNVNPNNILQFKDKTFIQLNYSEYKNYPSYLTCISSDGNIYFRLMGNDDWVYQIISGSIASDEIVGFFYGNIDFPFGSGGWSFLIGEAAASIKKSKGIKYIGYVSKFGIDVQSGGYYILSENPGIRIKALRGSFIICDGDEYVLSEKDGNDIWTKIDGVLNRILITGITDPTVLQITDISTKDKLISFNAYREVWELVKNPISPLTSIVVGDSVTIIPTYLSIGDDYSIISCDMKRFYENRKINNYSISILSAFTSICADAFNIYMNPIYYDTLKNITIPNSITSIGNDAFKGNMMLSCLSIQEGTDFQYLGTNIIYDCVLLSGFEVKNDMSI